MTPQIVIGILIAYFCVLILISYLTSKGADNNTFYTGNRNSPWYLVAFGMIGASLSGVTFISIPGKVGLANMSYFQLVLGYLAGYFVIANILIPLYYRLNLISIYEYIKDRFGPVSYKTSSLFFLVSQMMGASLRLFLVAGVLQLGFFDAFNIPFEATVAITILLIWIYTFKGGIKTIVWTDTLQTFFMLLSVILSIFIITKALDLSLGAAIQEVKQTDYSHIFHWEWREKNFFFKQFISGAFIAIAMTGLDQNMMQKNLTCKNIKEAQKNMYWFSGILIPVNLLFLFLGALLFLFISSKGLHLEGITTTEGFKNTDAIFPILALNYFPTYAGIVFLLGIIAAAFSSADSSLTSLTTSFCKDFLQISKKEEREGIRIRRITHIVISVIMLLVIIVFKQINNKAVIDAVFTIAAYTYGPLLGIFTFGLATKIQIRDRWTPLVAVTAPILSYILSINSENWLWGYKFSFEILLVNALFTMLGLWLLRRK